VPLGISWRCWECFAERDWTIVSRVLTEDWEGVASANAPELASTILGFHALSDRWIQITHSFPVDRSTILARYTVSRNRPAMSVHFPSEPGHAEQEFAATYEEHYDLLVGIAVERFGISHADAETLVHEIFFDFLVHVDRIRDRRAWLIGAVYNASKDHLRRAQRVEPLPEHGPDTVDPRYARVAEQWPAELAAREAFARITPRCQLALRLRYIEGHTIPSIAKILDTTKQYAAKLVSRCLELAHRRYGGRKES